MTLAALTHEIDAARQRIGREMTSFAKRPEPETVEAARSLLSLLLRFERHWASRSELARATKRRLAS